MDESTKQSAKEILQGVPEKKNLAGLHTYAKDFGASISGERGDIVRRAIKEEEAKEVAKKSQTLSSRQNLLMFVGSILAVAIGIAAIVYIVFANRTQTIVPQQNKVPSIVFADSSAEIALAGLSKEQLIAKIRSASATKISAGTISYLFFTDMRDGGKYLVGAKSFLKLLSSNVPELLTDRLGTTFMFGVYGKTGGNAPFIILKTDAYNEAFDGMRTWESRLFDDLYQPFSISTSGDNSNLFEAKFEDAILKNKNTRVLRSAAGDIALLYTFVDDQTILMTTNSDVLMEISTRLLAQKVEQQ